MNREERAVALAGLTFFMFGLSIFLDKGSFVVPFPLNEFALLIVSFLFLIWHPKKGALPYLYFGSTLAGVLGSLVFWETVMSMENLSNFYRNYTVIDLAKLTQAIFLVATMFVFFATYREWYFKAIVLTAIGIYSYGFVAYHPNFMLLAFIFLMVTNILKPVRKPFHLMWVLYFLLFGMQWVSLNFA
ncbi:hypothetical protein N9355_01970 [Crocinitomicaceae bacterium]|nr:hypothetical protein [Crocinitomicaceae bacterium]